IQVELMTSGKDIKEVLAKLRAMEADARKKLTSLGATEASITAGAPRDANSKNPRQQQMEFYLRQQMGRGRKPTTTPAPAVTLALSLKAEWPLSGGGDELLMKSTELVEKIKAADIAGKKSVAGSLTPEQQEELEEQQ